MITDKIEELLKEVENLSAKSAEEVEQLRLKYLSKKGAITALMAEFRDVPADQKKTVGMKINELKQTVQGKINELKEQIENTEDSCCHVDLTCTPYPIALGARHPLTLVKNEIIDIPRWTTTRTCLPCSTLPPTTPPATCRTHSSWSSILTT